jgi:phosphoribosyl-ATP pyrophosphohydrolase/phosphoribosyl-AMP cyclohydrolase
VTSLEWPGGDELLPAIVQDAATLQVLMLAWMNREAYERTLESGRVTFYSRSRQRLWTKGESSGNWLELVSATFDCDRDTLLVRARPAGPACHLGTTSCFGDERAPGVGFLARLVQVVRARRGADAAESYTARLLESGVARIAQKVGEESVETVIAATRGAPDELREESADLVYHWLVLLEASGVELDEVVEALRRRHGSRE